MATLLVWKSGGVKGEKLSFYFILNSSFKEKSTVGVYQDTKTQTCLKDTSFSWRPSTMTITQNGATGRTADLRTFQENRQVRKNFRRVAYYGG